MPFCQALIRANPELLLRIQVQGQHHVFCPGVSAGQADTFKPALFGVKPVQAVKGTHPDHALLIHLQRGNKVITDSVAMLRVGPEHGYRKAIITVQAILRANPDIAGVILRQGGDSGLR